MLVISQESQLSLLPGKDPSHSGNKRSKSDQSKSVSSIIDEKAKKSEVKSIKNTRFFK